MITISPEKMTVAEKISAMEMIWNDLCQYNSVELPDWHESVLIAREQQRIEGHQHPMDWEEAKKQMRDRI